MINFDTTVLSIRYGVNSRLNLSLAIPYNSIVSTKVQGAPYSRTNRGIGDMVAAAELGFSASPQVSVEVGVKLPNGSVDETDALGQRIDDILSLGSGTTDLILGGSFWWAHAFGDKVDLYGGLRHRFTGGQNKWGYRFGDLTTYRLHTVYPVSDKGRLGVRFEGFHTEPDTWFGNTVPERGATFLNVGPTFSWSFASNLSVGGFVRFPVYMNLEGSQMVAPSVFGLQFTSDITSMVNTITRPLTAD